MQEKNEIMPHMFLGTITYKEMGNYHFKRTRVAMAVSHGIKYGYGIDTAVAYGNHVQVGDGIRMSGVDRKKIFLQSKLYNDQQNSKLDYYYEAMLKELRIEYIDSLLLHWPCNFTYIEAYKRMEELWHKKKVRYIGLANVEIRHLEEIMSKCEIKPHVIQIERHPYFNECEVLRFCNDNDINVQAYAPLGHMNKKIISEKILCDLAMKYNRSIPQIILRWHIQSGVIPVVRSVKKKRIEENCSIDDFILSENEMKAIDMLDCGVKIYIPQKYARLY